MVDLCGTISCLFAAARTDALMTSVGGSGETGRGEGTAARMRPGFSQNADKLITHGESPPTFVFCVSSRPYRNNTAFSPSVSQICCFFLEDSCFLQGKVWVEVWRKSPKNTKYIGTRVKSLGDKN